MSLALKPAPSSDCVTVYRNPWFSVVRENNRHYVRQNLERAGAVALVRAGEDFIFVRSERVAVAATLTETPRGAADPGESAIACAVREAQEETGYQVGSAIHLGSMFPDSGLLRARVDLVLVDVVGDAPVAPPDGEVSAVIRVPIAEVRQMVVDGRITDGFTLAALAHYFFRFSCSSASGLSQCAQTQLALPEKAGQ